VHVALDKRNNRWYCLKTIVMKNYSDEERKKAQLEAGMLRGLDHPGIVRYHDLFVQEDTLGLFMAYCEGGDLAQLIKKRAKAEEHFAEHEVLEYFVQIARALHYVHQKGILHRDLKTQNIFISRARDGSLQLVKLGDFGIAKVVSLSSTVVGSTIVGTPSYMSPEVCQGQEYGAESDVWGLGCILYEMASLQLAWPLRDGSDLLRVFKNIVEERQPPLPERLYSDELRELVDVILAKDPTQRPTIPQILAKGFIRARMDTLFMAELGGHSRSGSSGSGNGNSGSGSRSPSALPPTWNKRGISGPGSLSGAPPGCAVLNEESASPSYPSMPAHMERYWADKSLEATFARESLDRRARSLGLIVRNDIANAQIVHLLSTRFEGPSHVVASLVKDVLEQFDGVACYNPNLDNLVMADGDHDSANALWLKRWREMLVRAKETGGCVVQLVFEPQGLSPMQEAEAGMAADKSVGVKRLAFTEPLCDDEIRMLLFPRDALCSAPQPDPLPCVDVTDAR
jgi:NIMA (never in mitosis gene a)-related kinase